MLHSSFVKTELARIELSLRPRLTFIVPLFYRCSKGPKRLHSICRHAAM